MHQQVARGSIRAHVTKSHGGRVVLDAAGLTVAPGSRVALLGPNGSGKTTLLRLLAGLEEPDEGEVARVPASLRVVYLPQERLGAALPPLPAEYDPRERALRRELRVADLEAPPALLSGGECARLALARAVLADPDVLLLDEPTNDLDADALAWLDRFLSGFPGAVVLVSHDRSLVERFARELLVFEPGSATPRHFAGTPDEYEAAVARERGEAYARYEGTQERRRELTALLRERQGQARSGRRVTSRRAAQAQGGKVRSARRALERLDTAEKPFEPWQLQLALAPGRRGSDVVVRLEGAVVERGSFRLGPYDLELRLGDRLLLAGPNGAGKSTLLQALAGGLPLAAGTRDVGRSTVFGTLDQDRTLLSGDRPLLDALRSGCDATPEEARTLLAKFGLRRDDALRPCRTLTPGERTRAQLALLVLRRMNALLLDEPSNHLDREALVQLGAALEDFPGAVVLVTHDERLRRAYRATHTIRL